MVKIEYNPFENQEDRDKYNQIRIYSTRDNSGNSKYFMNATFVYRGGYDDFYLGSNQNKIGERIIEEIREERTRYPTSLLIEASLISLNKQEKIKAKIQEHFPKSKITLESKI